ncbi:S-layer glycoprotein N-glycosyltransferase AglJ [Halomicrobium salinisoli]|uniref:S-layer glycoprotein N-glycosyltransferase AglJ n=1 Tax=Halomicrobium salinisoli TaxID=2878391 RepID=UPI001CF04FF9|nr:S-layer glycoprotein N-glycosyltransferase AglJ [Halomicrobium salinisoli]
MADRDDVCVLVPTYQEAETIGEVVSGFRERGFDNVLVIDGGSTDGTREVAEDAGARVVTQSGSGKGQAVREAIDRHIRQPYVLMLDGDATYRPDEADQMLEPLFEGEAEHVIGNRFADMRPGAMTRLNQIGNRIINAAFSVIHGRDLVDILSGYRAFTLESARRLPLSADGFGIETELAVECVKNGVTTTVVPITYEPRPDESETNLRPFRDGARIVFTIYRMAKTNNPLFYFGSVGTLSTLAGVLLAIYVAYEWFVASTSHEVLAIVGASAILFGVQLLMFGVLSDMIVTVNREQTRRIERIARQLGEDDSPTVDPTGQPGEVAEEPAADGGSDEAAGDGETSAD